MYRSESDNFAFEFCSLCLPELSMDLHATGRSCLSFGFLSLVYGLHGLVVLIRHDFVSILFIHVNQVLFFLLFYNFILKQPSIELNVYHS